MINSLSEETTAVTVGTEQFVAVGADGVARSREINEMYERTQRGVTNARRPEWNYLGRGLHRERRDADGFLIGDATDEVTSRGIWRHYRALMEAA